MWRTVALLLAVLWAHAEGLQALDTGARTRLQDTRANLSQVRTELQSSERALNRQSRQERADLQALERLNRVLAATQRDARTHQHNLRLVLGRLRALADAVGGLEDEEDADRVFLKADLVGLYKVGAAPSDALPFSDSDAARARLRARYLAALASATSRRMNSLEGDRRQLDAYRVEFDARYQGLRRSMSRSELTRRRVERERAGNEQSLRRVRVGKARSEEAVRRLKVGADHLQGMLSALQHEVLRRERAEVAHEQAEARAEAAQSQAPEGESPSGSQGEWIEPPRSQGQGLRRRLPWPVSGQVLSRFGKHLHPLFHVPVFNRGIEIAADYGSPVRVVSAGTVDYAGPLEGFGQLVVVDHGRGMLSVYGYGSRLLVREGQALRRGDAVEDVGEAPGSGRASLYFEISRGAKAQNPLDYLARR